jgi:hypothetical protein
MIYFTVLLAKRQLVGCPGGNFLATSLQSLTPPKTQRHATA